MILSKKQLLLFSSISGLMLAIPWLVYGTGLILLFAFIPLLLVENSLLNDRKNNKSISAFLYGFLIFIIWNSLTTWWIYNAASFLIIAIVIFSSLLMALPFWFFHIVRRVAPDKKTNFIFVLFWLAFEYLYINGELSFPWLNLGNGLANNIYLIQWYEYTGALGGAFWILTINIFATQLYLKIGKNINKVLFRKQMVFFILLIIIPISFSLYSYVTHEEKGENKEIVILQPNVDPYKDKFEGMSLEEQVNILVNLADSLTDDNTNYIVAPETAIPFGMWEDKIEQNSQIRQLRELIIKYPNVSIVTGINSRKLQGDKRLTHTARKFRESELYYDSYNSAIQLDKTSNIPIYHKSKLVVGVEKTPFPELLSRFEGLEMDLGGISGNLGWQDYRTNFINATDSTIIAPVICYESIYGEFLNEYIQRGAELIFIITNDGWWRDTPGYKQHLSYARIRAIETRRSIARSANTGISCFVNQRGDVIQPTKWWTRTAIKGKIKANNEITYYVKAGDYLGKSSLFISLLILIYTLIGAYINRKENTN